MMCRPCVALRVLRQVKAVVKIIFTKVILCLRFCRICSTLTCAEEGLKIILEFNLVTAQKLGVPPPQVSGKNVIS